MEEIRSLEDLLDLQREDSAIDRLLDRRSGLPELSRYRAAHEAGASLDAALAQATDLVHGLDLELDRAEGELQLAEAKLEREERRLYAGGINAKEAEHLRREVEMLQRQNSESETRILEILDQRDGARADRERLQGERAAAAEEEARLEESIEAQWRVIDSEIAGHEARKVDLIPLIPGELLALYEEIRPFKEGVAAARLAEGICGGCHLALSAAEQAQVVRDHPPRCLHCRRILVPQ